MEHPYWCVVPFCVFSQPRPMKPFYHHVLFKTTSVQILTQLFWSLSWNEKVTKHCNKLPREVVMAPCLPGFKKYLDNTSLAVWFNFWVALCGVRSWFWWPSWVSFNSVQSLISLHRLLSCNLEQCLISCVQVRQIASINFLTMLELNLKYEYLFFVKARVPAGWTWDLEICL